ncbi:cytochrome c biogenesis protein ResB [Gordonia sp. PS3]|uniref:Cytochrome c biogenesis protein ResB n=1 Tax=Gordonia sihwensis NBRC 108236 TaxID=1223544 RepID=L7LDF8_9ACTN|nr:MULTISPECIES: cytochrome c biogenesis protein ResB [Gordonia]AUH67054.1 cytochrome c biogenesis protein ResB [Gordonia sp. YC-JH1]GAC59165.1 cytochrome c biogenesis protein ResB [Gordonia sihwensis NBRC 108236]
MTQPVRPSVLSRFVVAPLRKTWRGLTSMRTALALLFLLALAAIPGALLPQRDLNEQKTLKYIADHGTLGTWMDRLQLFEVFSSAWFTAIYLLLFISLVGCLTPRTWEHYKALRTRPVKAPRNLARMPRHITETVDGEPAEVADRITSNLRGWRTEVRTIEPSARYPKGAVEVSAEKGYLREFGNLVFHFALLALLVTIAVGKLFGYEGSRTLVADGDQVLCNTSTAVYDSFRSGSMVDGTGLKPFCIRIDHFEAKFLPSGQPDMYDATMAYTTDVTAPPNTWPTTSVQVNKPLRIAGDRVYVLGNGFAPTFTVTFPNGQTRTETTPFIPQSTQTMLSEGAVRFDTPAGLYPDEDERRKHQVAIEGLFAPDAVFPHANLLDSVSPVPNKPAVAIRVYQGDTGLDTGRPQNVYSLDQTLIDQGRLKQKASVNLSQGADTVLPDGTRVRFDGYQRWVSVQVSHNPAQTGVLISAIVMVAGLVVSLMIRRRRIWARIVPGADGDERRTVVEVAGLARTDQAGWGDGFEEQARGLLKTDAPKNRAKL